MKSKFALIGLLMLGACSTISPEQGLQLACDSVTTSINILTPYKGIMSEASKARVEAVQPFHDAYCEGNVTDVATAFDAMHRAAQELLIMRKGFE